jgi:hypothetical protein
MQGVESRYSFDQTTIRSTVSRKGFGVLLCIFSYCRSDLQPEKTILSRARTDFRVLGLPSKLCKFICTLIQKASSVTFYFIQCHLS